MMTIKALQLGIAMPSPTKSNYDDDYKSSQSPIQVDHHTTDDISTMSSLQEWMFQWWWRLQSGSIKMMMSTAILLPPQQWQQQLHGEYAKKSNDEDYKSFQLGILMLSTTSPIDDDYKSSQLVQQWPATKPQIESNDEDPKSFRLVQQSQQPQQVQTYCLEWTSSNLLSGMNISNSRESVHTVQVVKTR